MATNDAHYMRKSDARAHEILLCIQTGKTMSDPQRMRFTQPEFYLKTRDEMLAHLRRGGRRAGPHLGHRAALPGEARKGQGAVSEVRRSGRATPPTATSSTSRARASKSAARVWKRCARKARLKHDLAEYAERLDREIRMIQQMKFSGYFLIVWDFIRFAKIARHSRGPGPRIGRRQPGQLRDGDHRHRSAANTGCCSSAS